MSEDFVIKQIRQVTYQDKGSGEMKTKWIFRDDDDFSKDYSDFKAMEKLLNTIQQQVLIRQGKEDAISSKNIQAP
jgi:hypothetical protein